MTKVILSRSESGFNHVEPEQYKHRLLHFKGTTVHENITSKLNLSIKYTLLNWLLSPSMCVPFVQNNIRVTEVSLQWKSLNSGDVFVLDLGLHVIQVNIDFIIFRLCRLFFINFASSILYNIVEWKGVK